jgi:hypothetical protein
MAGLRERLERAEDHLDAKLRRSLTWRGPTWQRKPDAVPWLDGPDAAARIDGAGLDAETSALLRKWAEDGYVVVDDAVSEADIDALNAAMDAVWEARQPIPGLVLLDLRDGPDQPPRAVPHAELVAMPRDRVARMRAVSSWRIHGLHQVEPAAARLFQSGRLRELASLIHGKRSRPSAVINFGVGSQQDLHQDMAVFHQWPRNHLLGAWIACEDVTPASGPLIFYPGSHHSEFFPEFDEYPETNLRTADEEGAKRYGAYIEGVAANYTRKEFLAKKGQVLLWHGMLIHGGAPVADPESTRRSMVVHYWPRGYDCTAEVTRPGRW